MAVRAAAGCMMVAEATADVLAGLSGQFSSFSTAVETALT
jgi:hypothetical protein